MDIYNEMAPLDCETKNSVDFIKILHVNDSNIEHHFY